MERLLSWLPAACYRACIWIFTYLSLIPLSGGHWSVAGPLALLLILHTVMITAFGMHRELTLAYFIIATLISGLLGCLIFHFSFVSGCLLVLIWGYFLSSETDNSEHLWWVFLLSSGVATIDYLLPTTFPLVFGGLLLAELILIVGLTLYRNREKLRYTALIALLLAAAFILSGFLMILKPVFRTVAYFLYWHILSKIVYWFGAALSLLLNLIPRQGNKVQSVLHSAGSSVKQGQSTPHHFALRIPLIEQYRWLFLTLLVLIATLIIFRFYKMRKIDRESGTRSDQSTVSISRRASVRTRSKPTFFRRLVPPANPIRRAVFQLQKEAAKKGFGRRAGETLGEWVQRLDRNQTNALWISYYEKLRYGESLLTADEKKRFFESITAWKKRIEVQGPNEDDA